MHSEELRYTLSVAGKPVGEQLWRVLPEKHHWMVRVQTDFGGGILGQSRRVQTSRIHPKSLTSASYLETVEHSGKSRSNFETIFDRRSGLITLRQGKDEATQPLTCDYQDPVSLLMLLREIEPSLSYMQVAMIGANVYVQRLPDQICPTLNGDVSARVYYLRPGQAWVYVEPQAPYRILRMLQPLDGGQVLEVMLQGIPSREPIKRKRVSAPAGRRNRERR